MNKLRRTTRLLKYAAPLCMVLMLISISSALVYRKTRTTVRFERALLSVPDTLREDGVIGISYVAEDARVDSSIQYAGDLEYVDTIINGDFGRARLERTGNAIRVENIRIAAQYISSLSGGGWELRPPALDVLEPLENTWVSLPQDMLEAASTACPSSVSSTSGFELKADDFEMTTFTVDEASNTRKYEIRVLSFDSLNLPFISQMVDRFNCLGEIQKKDFKTRVVTKKDLGLWKYSMATSLGSDRVKNISIRQFGSSLSVTLQDATKNTFIPAYDEPSQVLDISGLPDDQQRLIALVLFVFSAPSRDGIL
jgi:hypothetical protein